MKEYTAMASNTQDKSMTITYKLGMALYINITNRCTNSCVFCVRTKTVGVADGVNLWLEREPTVNEVIKDIQQWDVSELTEFVFCGYGEPMVRTDAIIDICRELKKKYTVPIRINTNGQANLFYEQDITPLLAGLVDAISISMNAKSAKEYQEICLSEFGEKAYDAMLDFAVKCKQYIPSVVLTIVDVMPEEDIRVCREGARQIGVDFKVRHFVE
jgi:TatD family-associated radical SAM protein